MCKNIILSILLVFSFSAYSQSSSTGGGPRVEAIQMALDFPQGKILIENFNREIISEITIQGEDFSRINLSEIASAQNDKGEILLPEDFGSAMNHSKKSERMPIILDIELKNGSIIDIENDRAEDIERLRRSPYYRRH